MKVYATIRQEAEVNPLEVIDALKAEALGSWRNWVVERDGSYYLGHEVSMGSHSMDVEDSISKEKYDFIKALEFIKSYIKKTKDDYILK